LQRRSNKTRKSSNEVAIDDERRNLETLKS
jgi:hypothetical protein